MIQRLQERFYKTKAFLERHEKRLSSAALLTGFLIDWFTLKRIDLLFENLVILSYLSLIALAILVINLYEGGRWRGRIVGWLHSILPLVMQFALGGLFSAFLVFYSRSSSLLSSWPFLLVLLGILVGNEFFRTHYTRPRVQVSLFFVALFSFSVFAVPVVVGSIGAWIFIISGIVALVVLWGFVRLLARLVPNRFPRGTRRAIAWGVAGIFVLINLLYFTNLIPPIPLSLKEADVAHFVERREQGDYLVLVEERNLLAKLVPGERVHVVEGGALSFYSAVFAPTRLTTRIVHHWEFFDEHTNTWLTASRVSFAVVGGRDGGYRGFSIKENIFSGRWRVSVTNPRGQILGRHTFTIVESEKSPTLEARIR